jgi:hypothetical protein
MMLAKTEGAMRRNVTRFEGEIMMFFCSVVEDGIWSPESCY